MIQARFNSYPDFLAAAPKAMVVYMDANGGAEFTVVSQLADEVMATYSGAKPDSFVSDFPASIRCDYLVVS